VDRRRFVASSAAAAAALAVRPAFGEDAYPSHAITFINPFPPGGAADVVGRPLTAMLEPILKQPCIVETKAGAAGQVGGQVAASAKPDGYTLLIHIVSISGFAEVDKLFDRPPKFTRADFVPIARLTSGPMVLLVNDQQPYKSVKELVDDAKANPDKLIFSSSGLYGALHLPTALFMQAAGIKMKHLPTNGGGPALTAFLGSQVDITAQAPGVINPHARDGKVRLLAHWGGKPTPELAGIPTMIELGYKDVEYYIWAGLFAPKATPPGVISRLRDAMRQVMNDPQVTSIFEKAGSPPAYMDQPEFAAFVAADAKRLVPVIKSIGRLDEKEK